MSLLYDIAHAARLRDWSAIDRALDNQLPSLDVCMARSAADGETLPDLDAPDPVTVHDLPPGALVVTSIGVSGTRKWEPGA